jgi:transcriptional regulator with XRE-family HTH domain
MRKRRGMTQEQVAVRMGVSVARVSQIESGDVSTQDALSRFVAALGGTLKLVADFGDEQLRHRRGFCPRKSPRSLAISTGADLQVQRASEAKRRRGEMY